MKLEQTQTLRSCCSKLMRIPAIDAAVLTLSPHQEASDDPRAFFGCHRIADKLADASDRCGLGPMQRFEDDWGLDLEIATGEDDTFWWVQVVFTYSIFVIGRQDIAAVRLDDRVVQNRGQPRPTGSIPLDLFLVQGALVRRRRLLGLIPVRRHVRDVPETQREQFRKVLINTVSRFPSGLVRDRNL